MKTPNIQLTDHFFFFGLAAGATQAQKRKNGGNCFSLSVLSIGLMIDLQIIR